MGLMEKIRGREAVVGVIGLGHVGLPLVRLFCQARYRVIGFDVDAAKIVRLRAGESYIQSVTSDELARFRGDGLFGCTEDFDRLAEPDAILICVPTPLSARKEPDLSFVISTAEAISRRLRGGQLVVLESTTYPGTTDEVVRPILDRSGLELEAGYLLAYSPEREDPGNKSFTTAEIPKVVGACGAASLEAAEALYGAAIRRVVPVGDARTAEAVKMVENMYRCVNIAMVNELKMLFTKMGIDIWEVIDAAATKPFGFHPFYPGPGPGGHCIPIDPFYLAWKANEYGFGVRFIQLAAEVNAAMPDYVSGVAAEALDRRGRPIKDSKVLVLGVAYKRDVDDTRESPALRIIDRLIRLGARVEYHDPHVPHLGGMRHFDLALDSVPLSEELLASVDCVLIVTDHGDVDYQWLLDHSALVVDSRNVTRNCRHFADRVVLA